MARTNGKRSGDTVQVGVRLDRRMVREIDAALGTLLPPGAATSRSNAIRVLLARLEREEVAA